jgi:uncharacterized protein
MSGGLEMLRQLGSSTYEGPAPQLPAGFKAVDAHVHLFPDRMFEAIWQWFDEHAWKVLFKRPVPELLEYLRGMGVRKAVCLIYAHKPGVVSGLNRWIADLAAREPMVIPIGAFHQGDLPSVITEALDTLNLKGIKLHCNVQRARPDDPGFFPLYEALQERGRILVIHAGTMPVHDEFVGMEYMRRVMKRFPDLKVQVGHMGAGEFHETFRMMEEFPNLTTDISVMFNDRLDLFPPELRDDVIRFADRILFGSDFPNIWFPPEAGAASFLAFGFPDDVNSKVFYENASRLYNVDIE